MLTLDWWVWELMTLIAGYLGTKEQAVTIVIMQIVGLAYMLAYALEMSSCTLIGQQIGKGDLKTAKAYFLTFQILTAVFYTCITISIYVFRLQLLGCFTSDL